MALALRLRSGDGTSRKRPAPERSNRGTGPSQHGTALLRPKHPSTCPASWTRRRRRRRRRHTPHLSLARLLTTRPRRRPRTAPTTTPPTTAVEWMRKLARMLLQPLLGAGTRRVASLRLSVRLIAQTHHITPRLTCHNTQKSDITQPLHGYSKKAVSRSQKSVISQV